MRDTWVRYFVYLAIVAIISVPIMIGGTLNRNSSSRDWKERVIYSPEFVNTIDGRALSDPSYVPEHKTMVATFNQGDVASNPVSWDVGDFTGLHVGNPKENYQRGYNGYGWSALQLYNFSAGAMVNTYSIPTYPSYPIANGQIFYHWSDSDDIHPWRYPSSILTMHFNMIIPDAYRSTTDTQVYANAALLLKDTSTGKEMWYVVNMFDLRGTFSEVVTYDSSQDTGLPMVLTYFGSGTRYAYRWINSSSATGNTFNEWKFFEFCINTQNLTSAVNDLNAQYGSGLSTDASNYVLVSMIVEAEVYWPGHAPGESNDGSGNQGHIGFAVKNIYLTEVYDEEDIPELGLP